MKDKLKEVYLVGGAVRDMLLGLEPKDKDYVVIGSTPEEMINLGYEAIDASFPVFLHPETKYEYALARGEKKNGVGYRGFEIDFSPNISIEQDLARRDLTINAIAFEENSKKFIDPFNGIEDLKNKVLRHTTEAFKEDPLRVLRLARFACRYSDFTVAEETILLCKEMVKNGELNHLTAERVYKEIIKVFTEDKPSIFFDFLQKVGALKIILPELDALKDVPQVAEHHPEICSFKHTMLVIDKASDLIKEEEKKGNTYSNEEKTAILFSALVHDLGKGITPKELLPRHLQHEEKGIPLINEVCERLKVTNLTKKVSFLVGENHLKVHRALENNHKTLLKYYMLYDYHRNPKLLDLITLSCKADSQGRLGFEDRPYPQRDFLMNCFSYVKEQKLTEVIERFKDNTKVLVEQIYKHKLHSMKEIKDKELVKIKLQEEVLGKMMRFNNPQLP